MLGGDLPREINLNMTGVLKLKIEFSTLGEDYQSSAMIDFAEAKLIQ